MKGKNNMRAKLRLDTLTDVQNFVRIANEIDTPIIIKDGDGHCVSGKSIMGMLYSLEWKEIWCECNEDIYSNIEQYVV